MKAMILAEIMVLTPQDHYT